MKNRFCAFDVEIVKEIPEGITDWKDIRPLGISCAATICSEEEKPTTWYHGMKDGNPIAGAMTHDELWDMLMYLIKKHTKEGYRIVTWNGLQFDFDILAEETGELKLCSTLAMQHIDLMFHFFCSKGFMLGLNVAAIGMGFPGKTEGMHGDLAPVMWAGTLDERMKVLEYVGQDVITTLQVAEAMQEEKQLTWIAKSGRRNWWYMPNGLLSVKHALELPIPDQSWMSNPKTRESFYEWVNIE